MLYPRQMSKVLVAGTKDALPETIEILFSLEAVQIIDFSPDEEGFSLGSPLPVASTASHELLKLRAVEKDLDVDGAKYEKKTPVHHVERALEGSIAKIESEIQEIIDDKIAKQSKLNELENRRKILEPFEALPLDLEAYHDYHSLAVLTGRVTSDPETSLKQALDNNMELFKNEAKDFIAVFVPVKQAEEARRALITHGFSEIPIPDETGSPSSVANALDAEIASLKKDMHEVLTQLEKLRDEHATIILASEEYLGIQVEKSELPLKMGETAHSFVFEAWIPTNQLAGLTDALIAHFKDSIYVEVLENKDRTEPNHSREENKLEAGVLSTDNVHDAEEPPSKLENSKVPGRFEFFTKLVSTPRYNEIDPTIMLSFFFPLFFGLMIGDIGYGAIFTFLGWLGLRKTKSVEWKGISTMLFYGGIFSIIFGIFLFGDVMGIELTAVHPGAETTQALSYTWSKLLGISIPHVLFTVGGFPVQLGYLSKLLDIKILLYVSVLIGLVHLELGLILGVYNVTIRHGLRTAVVEKASWLLMLTGGIFLLPFLIDAIILSKPVSLLNPLTIAFTVLFVPGLILAIKGEGGKAIMELPQLLSNVLSYTRIAAIGMSKAGMAVAFNFIALGLIAPVGGVMLLAALAVFVLGHLMIFILAIISAGLHGIRLNYVEFFTKFYEGGGYEFNPLKIVRKYTMEE